ncbi:MAG: DNA polymerase I [bacterium]|jgi:DNA polymerase-1|nr:DNA polymerase I [bacterium]
MDKVFLVDGSSIFFRSFHAIQELRRADGFPTNALYGYIQSLHTLLSENDITQIAVAFDRPEPLFREQLYKEYKANRKVTPEDLSVQIPYIKQATDLLGIPSFEEPGHEADDLIGTMAQWLTEQDKQVIIYSSDKDLLQLVNDSVSVLRAERKGNVLYTEKEVEERYGVPPDRLIEVFALMGDTSDNIPGVPLIGEKTAIALIQTYGSLDGLYEKLDQITQKKRKENLIEYKEQAYLSRELVTIKTDIPMDLRAQSFLRRPFDKGELRSFYLEMDLRRFAESLAEDKPTPEIRNYHTVQSLEELQLILQTIQTQALCAVDTETTSLDTLSARLVGVSFSIEVKQGWYIPLGHTEKGNLPWDETLTLLKSVLESPEITKVGHNLKYDYHVFRNAGITLRGVLDDTLLMSYLLQPDRQSHTLDNLVYSLASMTMTPITALIGRGKEQISMKDVPIERVSPYACEDTDGTWRLYQYFTPLLKDQELEPLYQEIERPLLRILAEMERKGITVDPKALEEQSTQLGEEMLVLESEIEKSFGKKINLNSPSQIAEILYDDLKILTGRKRSTRADILLKLANDGVQVAQQILDYRQRQKIKSTYLDALRKLIRPETGRVHTTFHQSGANTGRISSSDPNLQNIPTRTDLGRRVRRAFIAATGHTLVSLDYSQIELRILAHISHDPGLIAAFSKGEDIHSRTAADIFGVRLEEVTADMRRKAKEINFGLNYGMSPYGLAKRLGISDTEASTYIETYFKRYPNVQSYMDETIAFAKENRYVVTVNGRRIPTPGIHDNNRMNQENAKRAAINAPIQGSAADLLKAAMIQVATHLNPEEGALLLTVHDELVLEVREGLEEKISARCRELMEKAIPLSIPTPVELTWGTNWAELK